MAIIVPVVAPVLPTPGSTASDQFGYLTATYDAAWGGVRLRTVLPSGVYNGVRFLRNGVVVRGGDIVAVGTDGIATAYDFEAPAGLNVYSINALYYLGGANGYWTEARVNYGGGVSLTLPDLTLDQDFYVKSIYSPVLSRRLTASGEEPTIVRSARNSFNDVLGAALPAGSWDVHTIAARTVTFLATTAAQRDDMLALFDSGPLLVQSLGVYALADFYAIAGDVSEQFQVGGYDPRRLLTVSLQPIPRPSVVGAPTLYPGNSWATVAANYTTWTALAQQQPTWDALL